MIRAAIINGDDFGLSPGINRGIIEGYRDGILTSASLMVVGDAFEEAVTLAHEHPGLSLGIHLTLIEGVPVLPPHMIPSLVTSDGRFCGSLGEFLLKWLSGGILVREVEKEFTAQIDKARDRGIRVDKLDSHMHIHLLPGLFSTVLTLAQRYHITAIRLPTEGVLNLVRPTTFGGWGRRAVLTALSTFLSRELVKADCLYAQRCIGIAESGHLAEEDLLRLLQRLRPGLTEIMVHPGYDDTVLSHWPQSRRYKREQELTALTSPRVKAFIQSHRIELLSFSGVAKEV
jgi:hopanoid biosynthesis associated protein HpnK